MTHIHTLADCSTCFIAVNILSLVLSPTPTLAFFFFHLSELLHISMPLFLLFYFNLTNLKVPRGKLLGCFPRATFNPFSSHTHPMVYS